MDEEIYSSEEKQAFHRVGEFLAWFARLEAVIDRSIIDLLQLETTAGELLMTYLNFSAKCTFLQELVTAQGVGLTEDERKTAKGAVSRIRELADIRNTIAHSMFSPTEGGIKFSHGKKKLISDRSKTIDEASFDRFREMIAEAWSNVASIASQVAANSQSQKIAELVLRARLASAKPELGSKPH